MTPGCGALHVPMVFFMSREAEAHGERAVKALVPQRLAKNRTAEACRGRPSGSAAATMLSGCGLP